jgi:Outer membrane protein beta-barrel family/Carboxypeptidase regulatory-like domain
MRKPLKFCLIFCLFFVGNLVAQHPTGSISGLVQDADNKPLAGMTITLLSASDSTVIATTSSSVNGAFELSNIKNAPYNLMVSGIGFATYRQALNLTTQTSQKLPAITMHRESRSLQEVSVTASKGFTEQKIDRTVVNVNALISNNGANALEVLEKTPGVQVDADGTITFKGKTNVLVMIDDKPTYLSGSNLVNYLRSLSASSLNQIELMDNPPAKYDAAGNAGVINIKTKKNLTRGFNGTLAGNLSQGFYTRTDENLALNYRVKKVNVFANLTYNYDRNFRRLEINRDYFDGNQQPLSSFTGITYFRPYNYNSGVKVGMDYFLSSKTTWGIVFTGNDSRSHDNSPVYSYLYSKTNALDSSILGQTSGRSSFRDAGVNLNYSHNFDSAGTSLTFDLDYVRYTSGNQQQFLNDTYLPDGTQTATQLLTNNLPGFVNIYAAKTDYSMKLPGNAKMESGLKSSFVNTDNVADYFNVIGGVSSVDLNNSNRFLYKENINAGYLNFNKDWKRISIQTGLRLENTNGHGHQLGNAVHTDSSFTKSYVNLFPTGFISYKLDTAGNQNLVLSYGRRIGRPNYSSLNPFIYFVDKFSQFAGNPFLKPQFTDVYKLTYNYKSLINATLSYNYTTDLESETIRIEKGIFISTTGNIGVNKNLDFSVSSNFSPAKWWTVNLFGEVYNNKFIGGFYTAALNQARTSASFNMNSQFKFGKGWSAEVSGFYNSNRLYGQFVLIPTEMINFGAQKKIMRDKGTLRLNLRDAFRTFTPSGTINYVQGTNAAFHNKLDTQVLTVGFTYNFGKKIDTPNRRTEGSADTEKSRVGN